MRERSAGGQAVESIPGGSPLGGPVANRPPPERSGPVKGIYFSSIVEGPSAGLNELRRYDAYIVKK